MKRSDRIKLLISRNWNFPGKERIARRLNSSGRLSAKLKKGIIWFNTEDLAIYASPDNYIEWTILTSGTYEEEISKLIRISLKKGDNALDIGANIGIQSLRMAACIGTDGRVIAFEPMEYLQDKFQVNMRLNNATRVKLLPFALSDHPGEAYFQTDPGGWNQGTFSLGQNNGSAHQQKVTIKVADELSEITKLQSLALVKIDVEGFELQVLKGLKNTLLKHHPRIIFEYDSNYWATHQQSFEECYTLLKEFDYTLYQITQVGCELIEGADDAESGNIFCIPAENGN